MLKQTNFSSRWQAAMKADAYGSCKNRKEIRQDEAICMDNKSLQGQDVKCAGWWLTLGRYSWALTVLT